MTNPRRHHAHTLAGSDGRMLPPEHWQPMSAHARGVEKLAVKFARRFGGGHWARLLARWHDLGKYSDAFQQHLLNARDAAGDGARTRGPDHSTAGAQHAARALPRLGILLAYALAGHHGGLPNGSDPAPRCLAERLRKTIPAISAAPKHIRRAPSESALRTPRFALDGGGYATAFFVRMVFSALVDADFLDTETAMNAARAGKRVRLEENLPAMRRLKTALQNHMAGLAVSANNSPLQKAREDIFAACQSAAQLPPGLFSLTAPTGGGKTLASLGFAIDHALRHGMERVIHVAPFTSIIGQTAKTFRDVFETKTGLRNVVLEHHSNFSPAESGDDDDGEDTAFADLASENWNARLIATTSVQFFESLHANKPSRCRKLHRLARSVIILDEAQALPPGLLAPCLRALEQLAQNYGATIVLCTATQPALARSAVFPIGLENVREILPRATALHAQFRRVKPPRDLGQIGADALAARLKNHSRALCIVGTRDRAFQLHAKLAASKKRGLFHLSARMCPVHRGEVIGQIRACLGKNLPCLVIATSLIEAGVDLDFPVVYRELAGLDSIAQAAGRCNREGRLAGGGELFIFRVEPLPSNNGRVREAAEAAAQILATHASDPFSPGTIRDFFKLYYWRRGDAADSKNIMACFPENWAAADYPENLLSIQFRDCAENFRLIDSPLASVIIPWRRDGRRLCDELRLAGTPAGQRRCARALQRFTAQIPARAFQAALAREQIRLVHDRFPVLADMRAYPPATGLHFSQAKPMRTQKP